MEQETLVKHEASPVRHGQGTTAGGEKAGAGAAGAALETHAVMTAPTTARRRLTKKPTPAAKKAPTEKGKGKTVSKAAAKAAPAPEAKAPAAKRGKAKKGKAAAVKKEKPDDDDDEEGGESMKIEKQQPPSKKAKATVKLPPPLGTTQKKETKKATTKTKETKTKKKVKKMSKKELLELAERVPGWHVEKGASDSDPGFLWKAYGDLSRMPKTDSIVAVSLNNGVVQTGDAWSRGQGHLSKDERDWIWWNGACVPALQAIASGSASASAFSPEEGTGLAAAFYSSNKKKKGKEGEEEEEWPINLLKGGSADAAVSASQAAAARALSSLPASPPRPLFLLCSHGVVKKAIDGKMAHKLEGIFEAAASQISENDPTLPFVVCVLSSKNKDGMMEKIEEKITSKLGLPVPDPGRSTLVAGAVGKSWFEGSGGGGGGGGSRYSSSFAPPSDADAQFALQAGFGNVLEMPEAFGPTELTGKVSGEHGFVYGAIEHVTEAEKALEEALAAAAATAGAEGGEGDEGGGSGGAGPSKAVMAAAAAAAPPPRDGRSLIAACERVLEEEAPGIKNNRGLLAMFQALRYYWKEVGGDKRKARTFDKVAETLARLDSDLGPLDSKEKFGALCRAGSPSKLEGFADGTLRRFVQWDGGSGLPEELEGWEA